MPDHNSIQRFAALQLFITDKTNGKFAIILSNKPKITQQGIYYQILLNKTTPTE
jgi:hypothetical protein